MAMNVGAVDHLAGFLAASVLIGDAQEIAPKLGAKEPWGTIKVAVEDVIRVWYQVHPNGRTAHDRAEQARRWTEERRREIGIPEPELDLDDDDLVGILDQEGWL
jgi:hypothetical protein